MENNLTKASVTEVSRILRHLNQPESWKDSPWLSAALVKGYLLSGKSQTNYQALKDAFSDTLKLLAQENPDYEDILRGRFWEEKSVAQMLKDGRPQFWEERNFYLYQKKALARFTSLLLEQEQACQALALANHPERSLRPAQKREVKAGVFFSFIGLLVLALFVRGNLRPASKFASKNQTVLSFPSPTASNTNQQIVFHSNFEADKPIEFSYKVGLWAIVSETRENKVLEVNSLDSPIEYPVLEFGKPEWKDFTFETRVNIVDYETTNDAPLTSVRFRGIYKIAFTPYWKSVELVLDPPWTSISERTIEIRKKTWYALRIEVAGDQVDVFLDDKRIITDTIGSKTAGVFGLSTWPAVRVQFDDLIISIPK
ncbi:MAG: hypothetical protein IT310_13585 [Anaerolineales bacterium]|nr:hypothetical protein [Anaerolineales bacterium]